MTEIIRSDAATLSAKIATKELSSVEVTQACLDQIEATDDRYRAFLHVAADEALSAAAAVDNALAAGERLPSALAGGHRVVDGGRGGQCLLGRHVQKRVIPVVGGLDPVEAGPGDFRRRELPGGDLGGQRRGVGSDYLGHSLSPRI